ncbi:MAG: IS630 family transposase [Symploca sp. SIO2D2]|nr:IS630 family transposase [Symploca sp. SIO2D2]
MRIDYWKTVNNIDPETSVFLDETGINLALVRQYGRALKGCRAYGKRPYSKGKNITVIGAIALKGFLGAMTVEGGTNGEVFRTYLQQILLPNLWPGACVIMDNLSTHKVRGIRELIESVGARVIYLSPYSPEFNPIENCWSKLKEFLRSVAPRCREAVESSIAIALEELITLQDIRNWFAHCCYCTTPNIRLL